MLPVLFLFLSALLSYLLGFPIYRLLLHFNIIDRPNERSSHTRPTARGGGAGIILAILISSLALFSISRDQMVLAVALVASLLALLSFVDDLRSLPQALRFGCHSVAAVALLALLPLRESWADFFSNLPSWMFLLAAGFCFLWITGHTNAFNFMDGINGIAGFQAGLTGLGMAILAGLDSGDWNDSALLFALIVAGAGFGFLPHNFPKARMFMGDVSSVPLGFVLAFLALWLSARHGWELLLLLLLIHANFVMDTAITFLRRVLHGEKWYLPHREHFYQRLLRSGKSHFSITAWEAGLQVIVIGLLALSLQTSSPGKLLLSTAVIGIWALFFCWADYRFRRLAKSGNLNSEPIARTPLSSCER